MTPNQMLDLLCSEETYEEDYGFCVPLKEGGFAWLVDVGDDTYIKKSDDGYWYNGSYRSHPKHGSLVKYLSEIKSGEGNWIISPQNDNSDLMWCELDYKNAAVIKRATKATKEYSYNAI